MKPLAVDFYCGLGGWADGLIAEGWDVIGFDIERHDYGSGGYPGQLVLQDVLTLHGRQFVDVDLMVGSSPCQEFSFRAMPWKAGKVIVPDVLPDWWKKSESEMDTAERAEWEALKRDHPKPPPVLGIALFEAQFRIQREACEAAGRHIPLVVENVRGAQKWVGRSKYAFGSFHLWGDVPALMPTTKRAKVPKNARDCREGQKVAMNFNEHDKTGKPGRSFQSAAVRQISEQSGISGIRENGKGDRWFQDGAARHGSKSNSRKAASAMIAKIPLALSRHIARSFKES